MLILELCRQLSDAHQILDEPAFSSAVYFGAIVLEDGCLTVEWAPPLADIATRWRMFYFHHFMSVALEGLFSWLVSQLGDKGLSGSTVELLAEALDSGNIRTAFSDKFGVTVEGKLGTTSPADFFALLGIPPGELCAQTSRKLDDTITPDSPIAENRLEEIIRENVYRQSPAGLAVPMVLIALTLGRFTHWQATRFGEWLASAANDFYLDLIPPILADGLTRKFGDWWARSWKDLASFVLSRYVVRQHIAMSYEKTAAGDRCLLQVDGDKVMCSASYDKVGIGNPRFRSAVQILKDLALLRDNADRITVLTEEGQQLLDAELARKAAVPSDRNESKRRIR